MAEASVRTRTTIPWLDAVRFAAALIVVLYHYTAYDLRTGIYPVTRYGNLGVPLFFIISGLVIAMSLEAAATPVRFLVNRATRLYPAFVVCSAITVAYVAFFTSGPFFTVRDVLVNLTMFGELLHGRLINGSYWTLAVEWVFYLLMFGLWCGAGRRALPLFLWAWLAISAVGIWVPLGALPRALVSHSAPFFIAGAALYLISTGKGGRTMPALVVASFPVALYWTLYKLDDGHFPEPPSQWAVIAVITACYLLVAALALRPRWTRAGPVIVQLAGRASYPLYLLHETIGAQVLHRFYRPGASGVLLIAVLVCAMVAASVALAVLVEQPLIDAIKRRLASGRGRGEAVAHAAPTATPAQQDLQ
ncbi:acyltransferase [Paraburkholderia sp. MMS20-SJTR3]|uniref:Acyltransferase n=1 Tax=Paraburkholderia sejongensis TaxID=2886946 RepID=A0ABS8JRW3_9BURK|nr:acyltransferase [Paraburkholderia sp. MMS20-SJTR3]MCC8392602.1 acyltransferase [Paraburkholderia sp. MMS20-SJTR3]